MHAYNQYPTSAAERRKALTDRYSPFPSRETVAALRAKYPPKTRVRLRRMDDIQAPPIGTEGTVFGVDDAGNLLVNWDNGSSLSAVYGKDLVDIIKKEE